MTEKEIERLVDRWVAGWTAKWDSGSRDSNELLDIADLLSPAHGCDPEVLWRFVTVAYRRDLSDEHLAVLAAGEIEDLIAYHGPDFIDRIETEARQNPKFKHLLGGVWRNSSKPEVWSRVQAIRGDTW